MARMRQRKRWPGRLLWMPTAKGRMHRSRTGDAPEPENGEQKHRASLAAALARAVDAKDSYTRSHSEMVSTLYARIAQ